MKSISLLLPTRGRPSFMTRVFDSAMKTALNPDQLQVIFYIDSDDQASITTASYMEKDFPPGTVKYIIGERIVLSEMWNKCYQLADAEVLMHCGDDIIFQTPHWDGIVLNKFNEFPDKIAFVYGRDGIQPLTFGTHGFIHRNWVKTVGYFVPPYFSSDWNDTWLNDVSKMLNRHCYVDLLTEHIHPAVGKYHVDQTHKDRMERHQRDNVNQLYYDLIGKRLEDAEKLRKFIEDYNNDQV